MGVEVDSVIVDLEARIGQYKRDMLEAIALQQTYQTGWITAPANNNGPDKDAQAVVAAAEKATAGVTRARKARSDAEKAAAADEKQAAKDAAAAVKAAEKEKADAAKAAAKERAAAAKAAAKEEADAAKEVQRRAAETAAAEQRLAVAAQNATRIQIEELERLKAAEREAANQAKANAFLTGGNSGKSARGSAGVFREQLPAYEAERAARAAAPSAPVNLFSDYDARQAQIAARTANGVGGIGEGSPAEAARQTDIMRQTRVEAEGVATAEKEVNAALVEQARLQAGLTAAKGEDRALVREQLADMRTYNQLLRAGLSEEAAAVELDTIRVARARELSVQQAAASRSAAGKNALRFGEGAGLGRAYGSTATVAGIAVAAGAGIAIEAIKTATDYAQALTDVSKAAGISATALQVYQHAAIDAGAKSTDFDQAISELSNNLGRARTGSEQQAKAFAALGINIKTAASAGDLMPTLIDRISSISDQSKRAAVETALFGESGRKLDGLLSGGNDKVNELAAALERTGAILSSSDIAKLDDVSKKVSDLKAELMVDISREVANNAEAIRQDVDALASLANMALKAVAALDKLYNTFPDAGKLGDSVNDWVVNHARALVGLPPRGNGTASQNSSGSSNALGSVQSGSVNNKLLDSLNAPKGRKGRDPNIALNEADERTKRFNDTIARYQDEQLAAVAQQTADEETRRDQQRAQIQRDAAKDIADLRTQAGIDSRKKGADEALIQARLDQAIAARQAVAFEKTNVVNLEGNASAIDKDVAAQNAILEFKNQQLQAQEDLAKTAAERRDLELKILANEQQIAANSANGVLRKAAQGVPTSDADIAAANRTLANLPASTASKTAVIDKQTQGPLVAYLDSLPRTANQVNEAFQQAEVQGLQGFNSELGKTISGFLKLHGAAGQFIDDLVEIGIKWAEAQVLGQGNGAGTGGGGLGGLLGGLGKLIGLGGSSSSGIGSSIGGSFLSGNSILGGGGSSLIDTALLALPGLAGGGSIGVLGNGGIDRNVMSINGQPVARINHGETINVVPTNQRVNGSGPPVVYQTVSVDARGAVMNDQFASTILQKAASHATSVAGAAGQAAYGAAVRDATNAAPGRVAYDQRRGSS